MSLQIVAGKPGSGKSYHTVTMLLSHMEDWMKFEKKNGEPFDRVLYTNLPLQVEAINEYLSKQIGDDVDIEPHIKPIDENVRMMFASSGGKFPLALLPQNAMIVIDEVQKMFGAEMDNDKKLKAFETEFRNYISQHRHYGHDLIFITQDTANISKHVLLMAEKLYQVENAKHHGLPFPFNIPFADIDIVKEAFGINTQFYRVSVGKYQGRRVKFDKEVTSHLMHPDVFACYNSHTLSGVQSDRPSLNLSRVGAMMWFMKKHGWHLGLKTVIATFAVYWGINLISQAPSMLTQAMTSNLTQNFAQPVSEKPTVPKMEPPSPAPIPIPETLEYPENVPSCGNPNCTHDHSLPVLKANEKITAVFPLGVITDNGRRKIGQPVMIDGTEEIIKSTNVRQGIVNFESGKKVTVPK